MDKFLESCVKVDTYQDARGNKITAGWSNWPSPQTNQVLQEMAFKLVSRHLVGKSGQAQVAQQEVKQAA